MPIKKSGAWSTNVFAIICHRLRKLRFSNYKTQTQIGIEPNTLFFSATRKNSINLVFQGRKPNGLSYVNDVKCECYG